ncbi:high affinity immunoglobulin gamma Fc receptor I-like, partial [Poecilia latipinna]|uniref:high affinity immunoglobulin gamma Fc receptor I-like n=2 Tax=Poecilia latipinna TaxID=48699 RepID=UPI00072DC6E5
CEIQKDEGPQWAYYWSINSGNPTPSNEFKINTDTESYSGEYQCSGRRNNQLTEWSDAFRLPALSAKPKATVTPEKIFLPAGGSVTLTCSVFNSDGWKFDWFRQNSEFSTAQLIRNNEPDAVLSVSDEGVYSCRGGRGDPVFYTEYSNEVDVKTVSIYVTLKPNWPHIFSGETVTLTCEINGGGETQWTYEWRTNDQNSPTSSEYRINDVTESDSREYSCRGRGNHQFTQWSDNYSLTVSTNKPRATMTARQTIIPAGGSVTLRCSVDIGDGWRIYWFRQDPDQPIGNSDPDGVFIVSDEGVYSCRGGRGGRGDPVFYTETSREVTIWKTVSIKPTITWKHNWPPIFSGEKITLRC